MNNSSNSTLSSLPRDSRRQIARERCRRDPAWFIDNHCWLDTEPDWKPFRLWPAQQDTLALFQRHNRLVVLKARQLGLSWLALAYALWRMVFTPGLTVLFFSKGETEAKELLRRLEGMIERLPSWLNPGTGPPTNTQEVTLANGSNAKAFATTGGRSYTGSLAVVDEGDWFEGAANLAKLLNAVEPTVDAGGQLFLVSSPDKSKPESLFKSIYRAAKDGRGSFHPVFLPWSARPDRTPDWYAEKARDKLATTGALDDLHQEYPATDAEALSPRSLDKRIAAAWLEQCYVEVQPIVSVPHPEPQPPAIPGLVIYRAAVLKRAYVIGADPAEGNPQSDDSALVVLDAATGEEVAALAGKYEMSTFAGYIDLIGLWYNRADVLVERNNHGAAVLLWLRDNSKLKRLCGHDHNPGWNTTTKSKALLYVTCAEAFRDKDTVLHSFGTFTQLASIEGATLRAPEGLMDDKAVAYALALQAAVIHAGQTPTRFTPTILATR